MHDHAVQRGRGGQIAIERDEIEARAHRQLEVAGVVDRQRAFSASVLSARMSGGVASVRMKS